MYRHRAGLVFVFATCAAAFAPVPSTAQNRPARQHVLARGFASAPRPRPLAPNARDAHTLFGRIDSLRGALLLVRTRAGRLQRVDDGEALRSGDYSEPLFAGKVVVIRGWYDANRTLHARSVMRMGGLDSRTGPDR